MKKILFFLLLIPGILFSQTTADKQKIVRQTDTKTLQELSRKYKKDFQRNKEMALRLAKFNNWQLEITNGNTYSELVGVTRKNQPIYYMTYNEGAGITSRANKLYNGGGLGLTIQGENMLSAMWDAGSALASHEIFSDRLQIMDDSPENRLHSTHVAGTIIGSDQVQDGNAKGMAFKANLQSYNWDNDEAEVAAAAADGLLLSNHSYGYSPYAMQDYQWGKYDIKSRAFDEIMFNAPYFQFVCAAGNSRGNFNMVKNGFDLITGQGVSKNGITVAAVDEVFNYTGPSSVTMSATSSWGPTDDGRIKPDISAKGVQTYSSTNNTNSSYGFLSGTSMASPSVNGTLLLLQQYYNQRTGSFMRAATLKGLMIHTADEAGANPGPDYSFGWGLINAEKAANVITTKDLQSYILENTLFENNSYSIAVNAVGNEPLIATLCWTDPQGNIHSSNVDDTTPDLVNDLDIRITQSGDTFYPWKLNRANPSNPATQNDNVIDNVERSEIDNASGNYIVTVSHKGILANDSQNYSLIISGIILKDFWFITSDNLKSVCNNENTANFNFTLNVKGDFSETVTFSTVSLPAGITSVFSPLSMEANGNFALALGNLTTLSPGNYPFTVRGQSASDVFELTVTLQILTSSLTEVILQQPADNAIAVSNPVLFQWQQDLNAQQYDIQIATDTNFVNIVESASIVTNSYSSTLLNNDSIYYWRVKNRNQCGEGSYSNPQTFKTACILPSNVTLMNVTKTSATIGWTSNSASWEIIYVPYNLPPTGSAVQTSSNPITLANLIPNTCYDFYFKNTCSSGGPEWSEPFTFCTTPNYCGGDHFQDTGGSGANYGNNEDKTVTIYPENPGERVRAVFNNFQLDNCCDYLIIFNGPSDTSPFMYLANGDNSPGTIASTDISGALTFVFHSNGIENNIGWDASIICEPLPACPNAPDDIELDQITTSSAEIRWDDNSDSDTWEIEIVPHNAAPTGIPTDTTTANPYHANNLARNTCYDFYVRSLCTGGTSGWAGPFTFCTKAEYCAGDHFYDSGGATGNYENYEYKTTVISPQESGDRVKAVFNTFAVENGDSFVVYNGPNSGYPVLYNNLNNISPPGTIASTHNSGKLTFVFESNGFQNNNGWDATIICEDMPPCATFPDQINAENITISTAHIEWDNNCNPESWEIEIVLQGTTPTESGLSVATNSHDYSGLDSNTCYDVYIRSICENTVSAWSGAFTFCTDANYCAGDHFYDSGGINGNYLNDEFKTTVIFPDQVGNRVKAIFNSLTIDNCCDRLKIYNGPTRYYPILYNSFNGPPSSYVSTHSSGALTFVFVSDDNSTMGGWDATIICEALPQCANVPNNINTIELSATTAKIKWDENSNATSWEVKIAPHNTIPAATGTVVEINSHVFSGLAANTCYDFYVRSICTQGNSAWTQAFEFCTEPNYCEGSHFYDSGGANGNYENDEDKITIIYPSNPGDRVRALFNTYDFESCCDYFKIYNGPNTSYPLLYNDGAVSPGSVASTDISGALTFEFHSDGSSTAEGWDAIILCEPMPICPSPPSAINVSAITKTAATLNWTENTAATAWEIEIVLSGTLPSGNGATVYNTTFTFDSLTSNTCYDFFVRSVCAAGTTGWSGPIRFCTLADYCGGDHFYDSGGPIGNYRNAEHITTVIFPETAGDRVTADFLSFNLEGCCDNLKIYNGPNTTYPLLLNCGFDSPGIVASTDVSGALTFEFFSDGSSNAAGWDALISCAPLSTVDTENAFTNLEYYPNPVSTMLTIDAHQKVKKYTVYDIVGKLLWERKTDQHKFEVNMQTLSSGSYFIKLTNHSGAKTRTIKVLKK